MHKLTMSSFYRAIFGLGLAAGLSLSLLTSCSNDKDDKKDGKGGKVATPAPPSPEGFVTATKRLKVLSLDGKPLAKVQVLIGDSLDKPFANNFIETDSEGGFQAPEAWTEPQAVTLVAAGHVRATYLKQKPEGQTFHLRPQEGPRTLELNGPTTGFQIVNKDGLVDFGLVIPALTKQDLFNFDIGMVISTQMDEISILGQKIQIPSNVTLPTQKETYIFPITLDKPNYRMYFSSKGSKRIFAGRGQFPLKPVVDEMRAGKSFFELANYFKIYGGSLKDVELTGDKTTASLPVRDLNFSQSRQFKSPVFDNDQIVMALALSTYQGSLFPTDVKNVASNQAITLVTAQGETPLLLNVLKKKSETQMGPGVDRVSAALLPFENGTSPQMLAMMNDPQVLAINHLKADLINPVNGVTPSGSYAVLSAVEEKYNGDQRVQILTHLWEVYDTEWSGDYLLPIFPNEVFPKGLKKWEVSRTGTIMEKPLNETKILDLGPSLFESVTHATHSSADFK